MTKETKKQIKNKIAELYDKAAEFKERLAPRVTQEELDKCCEIKANTCKTVFYGYLDALEEMGLITKSDRTDAMFKLTTKVTSLYFDPLA